LDITLGNLEARQIEEEADDDDDKVRGNNKVWG